MVDDRLHIVPCLDEITLPIRQSLVQVKNRGFLAERHFIEEWSCQTELLLNELAMVQAHGNNEIDPIDQFFGQCLWNVCRGVDAFQDQRVTDHKGDRLRRGLDTSRFHSVAGLWAALCPDRIFGRHAAEHVSCAYKENGLHHRRFVCSLYKRTVSGWSTGRLRSGYNRAMPIPATATQRRKLDAETEKLQTRLCRLVGQAIADYRLIEDGDKVMVCLSGGKDSYGLLDILLVLQPRAPIHFDLIAVNLDQKQPGFPAHVLPDYLTRRGVRFHIESRDTYSIVKRLIPEGQTTCSLCSRLRRGHLYRMACELGATKIALGHHRDDIVETLFLNLFYTGKLKAIPPKLRSKDGRHLVIRPLALVKEADLTRYAELREFPIIPCDLCGSQEDLKRKKVKAFLQQWERESPGCSDSIAAALTNVAPSLLMDPRLFDFTSLAAETGNQPEGDAWLDQEPVPHQNGADASLSTELLHNP